MSSKPKVRTLAECEAVIDRGLRSFMEAGGALGEISAKSLFLETHPTFQQYCRERWGLEHSHVYRLVEAAEVAHLASPTGETTSPQTEWVTRPLAALKANPDLLRQTWSAIGNVTEKPTAELVAAVVARAKIAVTSAADFSEFLAAIVEEELEKIEAAKAAKAAGSEPRQLALPSPPKPDYFVLFDILFALNGFVPPTEMVASIPPDCWGRLDGIEAAADYLGDLRAVWKARREAANRRLIAS